LLRLETVGSTNGQDYCSDETEIQTLQICDGDVARNLAVPIYLVLPRLFTCPSLETPNFRLEFQVSLTVLFQEDLVVSETFPITLHRI